MIRIRCLVATALATAHAGAIQRKQARLQERLGLLEQARVNEGGN